MKKIKILSLLWLLILPLGTVCAQGFVLPTKKVKPYVKKTQPKVSKTATSSKRPSSTTRVIHTKKTYISKSSIPRQAETIKQSDKNERPNWLDGTWKWNESTLVIDGCHIGEKINSKFHEGTCSYSDGFLTYRFSDDHEQAAEYVLFIDLFNKAIEAGEEGENYRKISNSTSFEELREQTEEENTNKVLDECEQMPEFPGGTAALMRYLSENMKYPVEAQENGIQGRVVVSFIVETDGSISNIQVARSVAPSLDAEAVRVVSSMPKWYPGMNKGHYVRVKYNVPVTFRLG